MEEETIALKDAEFMSAKQKRIVLKQWERFVENRFSFKDFTKVLYSHLSLHCQFIAHFDRAGFYGTYFDAPEDTMRFLHQFDSDFGFESIEYGMTVWITNNAEYGDVNTAMCQILNTYKTDLYAELSAKIRTNDIARATVLLERHGLSVCPP
ncbi:MAG: hypothetical protein JRN20_13190 [Nitrososphaerota archaeon]|nr:hypothetical protein [Nitrososphaerota archaeon]